MFRGRKKTAMKVSLILLGALLIVVYLYKDLIEPNVTFRQILVIPHKDLMEGDIVHQTKPPTTDASYVYSWPRCEQNMSAANITNFNSLPKHIKKVLYYRHCRHFPTLLDVPDKCGGANGSAEVFLLLVIKSSPENYDRREVLRKTWAEERLHNGVWIRRIFITGSKSAGFEKVSLDNLLKQEQRDYNDILQWDFNDSFYNLTLKQILFLEWMERNCPHVRFLLNGDDDVFANTNHMVHYLQSLENNTGNEHLFIGHLIQNAEPIREPQNMKYIPVQVQESNSYPPYCRGGGFLVSSYTALVIFNMSQLIPILPLDDVYMGLCLAKAGLSPHSHMGVMTAGLNIPSRNVDKYDPCFYRDILLVHRFLSAEMYYVWHQVNDPNLECINTL